MSKEIMSKSKHTPGPWSVDTEDCTVIQEASRVTVARFYTTEDFPCLGHKSDQEVEEVANELKANADLIAAAPDLLEACQAAKRYLEPDLVEPGRTVFWKLVEAIKKATATHENK